MNRSNFKKRTDEPKVKGEEDFQEIAKEITEKQRTLDAWVPKTDLGRMVKAGKIASIDEIFDKGFKIMEPEIVDSLIKLEEEVVEVAKKTRVTTAGRKFSYRAAVLVGNKNGYIGLGTAKDVDRFPAITKAKRSAKLNLIRVYRGSGSWEEQPTEDQHSVPMKVTGQEGSVRITLMPAPKGTGLAVGRNVRSVFVLAGIQNVWSKGKGRTSIKLNFVRAAVDALKRVSELKMTKDLERKLKK